MSPFEIIGVLLCLAALCSYINTRAIGLPTTIGVMIVSLVGSVSLLVVGRWVPGASTAIAHAVGSVPFGEVVLHGMLAFLLFAGSIHIRFEDLRVERLPVLMLAGLGTAASTLIVGGGMWLALRQVGLPTPFVHCLLFGAIVSPTDPIAVIGILRQAGAPRRLETQMAGESLFNDGIGVVFFLLLIELTTADRPVTLGFASMLLAREVVGGLLIGAAAGGLAYALMRRVDHYQTEVLITLALATGGYALAERLHVSAPIAIVVAGLLTGNHGRAFAMSETTRAHVDQFWGLIDEMLNVVLFMLIGMEQLVVPLYPAFFVAGLAATAIVLFARLVSVAGIVAVMPRRRFDPGSVAALTWGGLRGGISVALALSLPETEHRNLLIAMTYVVVIFSIVVQGLTIGRVVRRVTRGHVGAEASAAPTH